MYVSIYIPILRSENNAVSDVWHSVFTMSKLELVHLLTERKLLLSILHFNKESRSFPYNTTKRRRFAELHYADQRDCL